MDSIQKPSMGTPVESADFIFFWEGGLWGLPSNGGPITLSLYKCYFDFISLKDKTAIFNLYCFSASVDLSSLKHEVTHTLDVELENDAGMIALLLTISGMTGGEDTVKDLTRCEDDSEDMKKLKRKYVSINIVLFKYSNVLYHRSWGI